MNNSSGVSLFAPNSFINQGEVEQTGAGNLALSGTFDNQAGATYDISGTGGIVTGGTFQSEGTLEMTGSGTATISGPIAIDGGTIDVQSGTLSIQSTNCNWTGGDFKVASAAILDLAPAAGNGIIMTGTYTGSGAGAVELTSGTLLTSSSGATFDFPQGLFQWQGGTINLNQGGTLTNTGFLTLNDSGGVTLLAPSSFINRGEIDQTGAGDLALNSGTLDNPAGAVYDISGTGGIKNGGTFQNEGRLEMTGSGTTTLSAFFALNGGTIDVASGTLSIQSTDCAWTGGTLTAATGATLQLAPDPGVGITLTGTYTGSGGGQVQLTSGTLAIGTSGATFDFPQGLFQWSGGLIGGITSQGTLTNASTGFIGVNPGNNGSLTLNNPTFDFGGTVNVESGTLLLDVPLVTGSDGSFTVAQGATVDLTAGGDTYTGTFTGSGAGTVAIGGAGFLIIGNAGATFNFPGSLLQWTGPGIEDLSEGDLTNLGTITFAGPATKFFGSGATLENKGTIIQTGTGSLELIDTNPVFPTILQNDAGALYEIEGDSSIVTNGQKVAIDNAGIIKKTSGSGTSTIAIDDGLNNTGTIEADSGTLALSATIAQVSSGTLTGGTWNALGGSTIRVSDRYQPDREPGQCDPQRCWCQHSRSYEPREQLRQLHRYRRGDAHDGGQSLEYGYADHRSGLYTQSRRNVHAGLSGDARHPARRHPAKRPVRAIDRHGLGYARGNVAVRVRERLRADRRRQLQDHHLRQLDRQLRHDEHPDLSRRQSLPAHDQSHQYHLHRRGVGLRSASDDRQRQP